MKGIAGEKLNFKNFFYNRNIAVVLWFGLALIGIILELSHDTPPNNYLIFKGVFHHTRLQTNLFAEYPAEYLDVNHYGPLFSLIIAPFVFLPDNFACTLWVLLNAFLLYKSIRLLPLKEKYQNAILIFSSHELMLSSEWQQSNAMICACLIFGFYFIHKGKEAWALLFIMLATFVKLYGIVGFAFFFFSKNKLKFILWAFIWTILFFVAPMLISTPAFIIQSYVDWFNELVYKAAKNVRLDINNDYQDISVMGMMRRIFGYGNFKNIFITIPALLLFASQYLQWKYFKDIRFRMYLLCLVLIMTVIYTTSAESPTYIIAFPAVCIWFVMQPNTKWVNIVFIFALLLTSFSYSDLFTPYVRDHIIRPYSLKALPCFIVWIIIIVQMWQKQFLQVDKERLIME